MSFSVLYWQAPSFANDVRNTLDLCTAQDTIDRASGIANYDTNLVKRHEAVEFSVVPVNWLQRYRWFSTAYSINLADVLESNTSAALRCDDDIEHVDGVICDFHSLPDFHKRTCSENAGRSGTASRENGLDDHSRRPTAPLHRAGDIDKQTSRRESSPFGAFSALLQAKDTEHYTETGSSSSHSPTQGAPILTARRNRKRTAKMVDTSASAHTLALKADDPAKASKKTKVLRPALNFAPHAPTRNQKAEALRMSSGLVAVPRPANREKAKDNETHENLVARRPATRRLNAELDPPSGSQVISRFLMDQAKIQVPALGVVGQARSRLADVSEVIEDFTASPIRIDADTSTEWDEIIGTGGQSAIGPRSSSLGRISQKEASEGSRKSTRAIQNRFYPSPVLQDTVIVTVDGYDQLDLPLSASFCKVKVRNAPTITIRNMLDVVFENMRAPLQDLSAAELDPPDLPFSRFRFASADGNEAEPAILQQILPPGRMGYWMLPLGEVQTVPWDPGINCAVVLGLRDLPQTELASLPISRIVWTLDRLESLCESVRQAQTSGHLGYVHLYPALNSTEKAHLRLACTALSALHVRLLLDSLECSVIRPDAVTAGTWLSSRVRLLWYDDVERSAIMSA